MPSPADTTSRPPLCCRRSGTNKDVCPDMELCRQVVRRAASRDHKMYDRYATRFEAKLAELGSSFAARVTEYKKEIAAIQATWRKVPRKQFICRYHPETSSMVPVLRTRNLRCPVTDGSPELCQSFYAHRLFEWYATSPPPRGAAILAPTPARPSPRAGRRRVYHVLCAYLYVPWVTTAPRSQSMAVCAQFDAL